jgi:aminoglycoside 6'-N-acetyltransferase I
MTELAAPSLRLEAPIDANDSRWLSLRAELWPHASAAGHAVETRTVLARGDCVLIAVAARETAAGFAEASIRNDYVNGTSGSPVAFLEGLYVAPAYRRQGVARTLVAAIERWTLARGCAELASDSAATNVDAHAVHRALGFVETERVVYFCKALRREAAPSIKTDR